jgi:hypothetical protein
MKKIVDMCCGCATDVYACRGDLCPNRHVTVYYCDKCKCEIEDDVYDVDGFDLCEDCLKDEFRKDVER